MSETQRETAVAFFIFNRSDTTQIVFDEIRKAKPKKLFVIADGPRNGKTGEAEKCWAARKIIEAVDWDCEVLTNFSEKNLGCKNRIVSGISWVFEHVEAAIILEDDCVPDGSFFNFCSIMLDKYKDDTRVMMISGTNLLFDNDFVEGTYYFSQFFSIWGWATWGRAWSQYDIKMSKWPEFKKRKIIRSIYKNGLFIKYIETIFDDMFEEKDDTWDWQWFFSGLVQRGLCIVPGKNLISNIGIDGTHSQNAQYLKRETASLDLNIIKDPEFLAIDPRYEDMEIKNILKIAGYSYAKYYAIEALKKLGLLEFFKEMKK